MLAAGKISTTGKLNIQLPTAEKIPKKYFFPIQTVLLGYEATSADDMDCPKPSQLKVSVPANAISLSNELSGLYLAKPTFKSGSLQNLEAESLNTKLYNPSSASTRYQDSELQVIYVDKAVKVSGEFKCQTGDVGYIYDINLNLPQGWSYIEVISPTSAAIQDKSTVNQIIHNAPAKFSSEWKIKK